mgnify:CR=1 FL=1
MIDDKIKEAITNIGKLHTESHHRGIEGCGIAACKVVDAYIQAEARARMAEYPISLWQKYYFKMGRRYLNEHFEWTITDYEKEVRNELSK